MSATSVSAHDATFQASNNMSIPGDGIAVHHDHDNGNDGNSNSNGAALVNIWQVLASAGLLRRYCRVAHQLTMIMTTRAQAILDGQYGTNNKSTIGGAASLSSSEREQASQRMCASLGVLHERLLNSFVKLAEAQSTPDAATAAAVTSKHYHSIRRASAPPIHHNITAPQMSSSSSSLSLPTSDVSAVVDQDKEAKVIVCAPKINVNRCGSATPYHRSTSTMSPSSSPSRMTAKRMKRCQRGVAAIQSRAIVPPPPPTEVAVAPMSPLFVDDTCTCVLPCAPRQSMDGVDGIDHILRPLLPPSPLPVDAAAPIIQVDAQSCTPILLPSVHHHASLSVSPTNRFSPSSTWSPSSSSVSSQSSLSSSPRSPLASLPRVWPSSFGDGTTASAFRRISLEIPTTMKMDDLDELLPSSLSSSCDVSSPHKAIRSGTGGTRV